MGSNRYKELVPLSLLLLFFCPIKLGVMGVYLSQSNCNLFYAQLTRNFISRTVKRVSKGVIFFLIEAAYIFYHCLISYRQPLQLWKHHLRELLSVCIAEQFSQRCEREVVAPPIMIGILCSVCLWPNKPFRP
jgi:hypothetical protein